MIPLSEDIQNELTAIEFDPFNDDILALVQDPNDTQAEARLVRIDRATGDVSDVTTGLSFVSSWDGIDITPDGLRMLVVDTLSARIYEFSRAVSCPEDVTGDEDVRFEDLLSVLSLWGPCSCCPEDIDVSGDVGFSDIPPGMIDATGRPWAESASSQEHVEWNSSHNCGCRSCSRPCSSSWSAASSTW